MAYIQHMDDAKNNGAHRATERQGREPTAGAKNELRLVNELVKASPIYELGVEGSYRRTALALVGHDTEELCAAACGTVRTPVPTGGFVARYAPEDAPAVVERLIALRLVTQGATSRSSVAILDVASGDRAELPGTTRTVDVPEDMDEATGASVAVGEDEDGIRFRWNLLAGGGRGGWLSSTPLSSRKPGERCMAESADLDDRGRRMWRLSTVGVDS